MSDSIGLVLLAAGGSARLGRPKQLVEYQGKTLLRRAAETALASTCHPVVVVLGAEVEQCRQALQGLPVAIVLNPDWKSGLASSIRAGILHLGKSAANVSAAIISVCDQPQLTPAILDALGAKHRDTAVTMVAAEYAGRLGVPALFAASLFPRLLSLTGDEGARHLLRQNSSAIAGVPFPGGEWDVDSPADCPPV